MTAHPSVLCAGHVNWDVVLRTDALPDPDFSADITYNHAACGGSAANTASGLASLDAEPALAGSIGDDRYGEQVVNQLSGTGIDPALVVGDAPTTVIYALVADGEDPRYFAQNTTIEQFDHEDLDSEVWESTDHLHVTSFSRASGSALAHAAREDGKTVSFNPTQEYSDTEFTPVVEAANLIVLNDREKDIFCDRHDFDAIAEDTCIVVTHGADGSTCHVDGETITHDGYPVEDVEDTVGAGDSYVAGFLSEWLATDESRTLDDYRRALDTASACGAYAVTQSGAPDDLCPNTIRE